MIDIKIDQKMKQLYIITTLLFSIQLSFFSCSEDPKVDPILPTGRTLLVYVALDNDLSNEMDAMRASLMEGWGNSDINGTLLLFADSRRGGNPVLINIKKNKGKVVADTLRTYTNDNSASPELFSQVIADAKVVAPSNSYGLVLFSHSTGWLPAKAFGDPTGWPTARRNESEHINRSIFQDNGREMAFADFVAAIPDGTFDFIASEMCFMSSVETGYALRNKTKYLLASAAEVVSPGFTPIYKTSLDLLFKPKADLKGFAQAFFDYVIGDDGVKWVAISVVKTSEMEALATFMKNVVPILTQEQINLVQYYDGNPPRSSSLPHLFFDFRDYLTQIATPKEMGKLDELLDKAVIFKLNTPMLWEIRIARHSGLSVYIPQDDLPRLNEAYEETEWWKAVKN